MLTSSSYSLPPRMLRSSVAPKGDRHPGHPSGPTGAEKLRSSVAPKGDRHDLVLQQVEHGPVVAILGRPEGGPPYPSAIQAAATVIVRASGAPDGDRHKRSRDLLAGARPGGDPR